MTEESLSVTENERDVTNAGRDSLVRARPDSVRDVTVVTRDTKPRDVTERRDSDSAPLRSGTVTITQNDGVVRNLGVTVRRLFAIDPGTRESGWVLLESGRMLDSGVADNFDVLRWIQAGQGADMLAIEMIAGMGMTVGQETFETVRWIGRFQQAWREPDAVRLVFRRAVKSFLCGNQRAKDTNIRQALLDIFPATGGGTTPQIGTKAKPGPLYGVASHAWSALAVAMTVAGTLRLKGVLPDMPQREMLESCDA